jgi:hypothetical protein
MEPSWEKLPDPHGMLGSKESTPAWLKSCCIVWINYVQNFVDKSFIN